MLYSLLCTLGHLYFREVKWRRRKRLPSPSLCVRALCVCVVYASTTLKHVSPVFLHGIRAWKAQESSRISPQVKEKESRKGRRALNFGAGDHGRRHRSDDCLRLRQDLVQRYYSTSTLSSFIGFCVSQKPIGARFDLRLGSAKIPQVGPTGGAGCSIVGTIAKRANLTCRQAIQVAGRNHSVCVWKLRVSVCKSIVGICYIRAVSTGVWKQSTRNDRRQH